MKVLKHEWRVFGDPKAQPRTKACIRGNHAAVYTPRTAAGWKGMIALCVGGNHAPILGPIALDVELYMPFPKRLAKRALAGEMIAHVSKPDVDNAIKAVMDVLTQLFVWVDDNQVCDLHVTKRYATRECAPGALITLYSMEDVS